MAKHKGETMEFGSGVLDFKPASPSLEIRKGGHSLAEELKRLGAEFYRVSPVGFVLVVGGTSAALFLLIFHKVFKVF